MRDVARLAGVSVQTVSNVINQRHQEMSTQTQQRVLEAVRELDFHPNSVGRALRARRSRTLGFLILDADRGFLADPMTDLIVSGVGDVVRDRGYSLLIHAGRPDDEQGDGLVRALAEQQLDGMLLMLSGPAELRHRFIDRAQAQSDHVMLFELDPRGRVGSVTAENGRAAEELVEHLAARGHRRIAFAASEVSWPMVEERHAGYVSALARLDLERDAALEVFEGVWTPEQGARAARRLMDLPEPPTAIMAGNDLLALGAVRALGESGRSVPGDVAVVGFNDFDFAAYTTPRLTTVRIPGYEMGVRAATELIDGLDVDGASPPRRHVLPVQLRLRDSA